MKENFALSESYKKIELVRKFEDGKLVEYEVLLRRNKFGKYFVHFEC